MHKRLVLRIYLIGLAQIAALAATLYVAREATRPRNFPHAAETQFLLDQSLDQLTEPQDLQARLQLLLDHTRIRVELTDKSGKVVASTQPVGPTTFLHTEMTWRGGAARVQLPPPPMPRDGGPILPLVASLILVGISAVLTAAWLGRPLTKLSAAARALGGGDLTARANLKRNDELGDVAIAFDEMAVRIEQLVRGQRELLANVSHELRTPLARIRMALDLAAEGSAEEAAEQLSGIAGDLAELERLTNDILASARLELASGAPPLRLTRSNIRQLLDDVNSRFRTRYPSRALTIDNGTGEAEVEIDRMLLRRALDNLLDNAARYSDAEIALKAFPENKHLVVEIKDQGVGIAAEDLPQLFTPFFRADRSRGRKSGGLGLGLVLSRRILEAHLGSLDLTSEQGKGTTARARVPLAS
ncbi:MAG TPA: HAMP domain-containing sensor histidine kinase [Myxococcales bacterium]|nr:HAMP domain-containing sensor histidine kinase [Myxococcales bacterium]